jgi:5-methylcytosine-specific restriction endonuclease McrA
MLLARDRYICAYCAQRFRFDELDLEHGVPSSKSGTDSWVNLMAARKTCSLHKANRTTGREAALRAAHPEPRE